MKRVQISVRVDAAVLERADRLIDSERNRSTVLRDALALGVDVLEGLHEDPLPSGDNDVDSAQGHATPGEVVAQENITHHEKVGNA